MTHDQDFTFIVLINMHLIQIHERQTFFLGQIADKKHALYSKLKPASNSQDDETK